MEMFKWMSRDRAPSAPARVPSTLSRSASLASFAKLRTTPATPSSSSSYASSIVSDRSSSPPAERPSSPKAGEDSPDFEGEKKKLLKRISTLQAKEEDLLEGLEAEVEKSKARILNERSLLEEERALVGRLRKENAALRAVASGASGEIVPITLDDQLTAKLERAERERDEALVALSASQTTLSSILRYVEHTTFSPELAVTKQKLAAANVKLGNVHRFVDLANVETTESQELNDTKDRLAATQATLESVLRFIQHAEFSAPKAPSVAVTSQDDLKAVRKSLAEANDTIATLHRKIADRDRIRALEATHAAGTIRFFDLVPFGTLEQEEKIKALEATLEGTLRFIECTSSNTKDKETIKALQTTLDSVLRFVDHTAFNTADKDTIKALQNTLDGTLRFIKHTTFGSAADKDQIKALKSTLEGTLRYIDYTTTTTTTPTMISQPLVPSSPLQTTVDSLLRYISHSTEQKKDVEIGTELVQGRMRWIGGKWQFNQI